jgi:hypothetical protein
VLLTLSPSELAQVHASVHKLIHCHSAIVNAGVYAIRLVLALLFFFPFALAIESVRLPRRRLLLLRLGLLVRLELVVLEVAQSVLPHFVGVAGFVSWASLAFASSALQVYSHVVRTRLEGLVASQARRLLVDGFAQVLAPEVVLETPVLDDLAASQIRALDCRCAVVEQLRMQRPKMDVNIVHVVEHLPASSNGTESVVLTRLGDEVDGVCSQEYGLASIRGGVRLLPEDTREFAFLYSLTAGLSVA